MNIAYWITGFSAHNPDDLLEIKDMAEILDVSEKTVKRMADKCQIPAGAPLGNKKLWRNGHVLEYIQGRSEKETQEKKA